MLPGGPIDLSVLAGGGAGAGDFGVPLDPGIPNSMQPATLPGAPQRTAALSGSPRDEYDLAYGYILTGDYGLAEESFRNWLATFPSDPQAADAQFWLGESHFQQREYRDAANAFLAVYKTGERSTKGPDALTKLGMSLAALGEKGAACATLAEVGRKYPGASPALMSRVDAEAARRLLTPQLSIPSGSFRASRGRAASCSPFRAARIRPPSWCSSRAGARGRRRLSSPSITACARRRPKRRASWRRNAARLGLPWRIMRAPARPAGGNLQDWARRARYACLAAAAREAGFDTIVTAHHQDDQAETFLLRLARGSGVYGLAAMPEEGTYEGLALGRPLLDVPRAELARDRRRKPACRRSPIRATRIGASTACGCARSCPRWRSTA